MPAPTCYRCQRNDLRTADRLIIEKDDEREDTTVRVDLCRGCVRELEGWLDPPESVRAGWKVKRGG